MSTGAWVMLIFGVVFLYGGLTLTVSIARKNS